MHYFKGKTEENMQHTSKFSPASRLESLFTIIYIAFYRNSQRLGMGTKSEKIGSKIVCWMGGFARRAKKFLGCIFLSEKFLHGEKVKNTGCDNDRMRQ